MWENLAALAITIAIFTTPAKFLFSSESDEQGPQTIIGSPREDTDSTTSTHATDVSTTPAGDDLSFNGWDVSKACYDPKQNKEYQINENWTTGGCDYFECKKVRLPKIRNAEVAIGVERGCVSLNSPYPYCAVLPKTTETYPVCCPVEICILGNMINVTGSTPEGARFNISKIVTNQLMANITKLERRELLQYALRESGYFKPKRSKRPHYG